MDLAALVFGSSVLKDRSAIWHLGEMSTGKVDNAMVDAQCFAGIRRDDGQSCTLLKNVRHNSRNIFVQTNLNGRVACGQLVTISCLGILCQPSI